MEVVERAIAALVLPIESFRSAGIEAHRDTILSATEVVRLITGPVRISFIEEATAVKPSEHSLGKRKQNPIVQEFIENPNERAFIVTISMKAK